MSNADRDNIDWSLTTWEGARREQLRRWAALPLENVVAALEEMQEISEWLHVDDGEVCAPGSSKDTRPAEKKAQR